MPNNKPTALIIDDEQDIRELIEMAFMSINIDCVLAPTIKDGIKALKKGGLDFCITDMRLPDGDGIELISYVVKNYPEIPVCMITAHGNMELAVKALKIGAFDFVNKPFDLKQLRSMAKAAMKLVESTPKQNKNIKVTKNSSSNKVTNKKVNIIGESPIMKKLDLVITKVSRSQAPVFIYGESGTGKELVARSIHNKSARQDGSFVAVNCGAIPENLVESEFFGYKKGAFTGANTDYPGLFASANGGTLFLDEVADLPLAMQVKLLRAIQEKAVRPVGSDKEIPVDIRILSATHKNLTKLVEDGDFREDLYYRLNVISIGMPPLRKRDGDVRLITEFLLVKLAEMHNHEYIGISDDAMEKLEKYDFPGNIRELENVLERAVTFCENSTLTADDINFSRSNLKQDEAEEQSIDFNLSEGLEVEQEEIASEIVSDISLKDDSVAIEDDINDLSSYIETVEKKAIINALRQTDNNKTKAAEKLGLSFRAFRYKVKKYKL